MAVVLTLTQFAPSAGVFNYTARASLQSAANLGALVSLQTSWAGRDLAIGETGTATALFANGYTSTIALKLVTDSLVTVTSETLSINGLAIWSWAGSVFAAWSTYPTDLQDAHAFAGNDVLIGNSANNALQGWTGNDTIDGAGGTDTAVFSGLLSQNIIQASNGQVVVMGPDGTDTLTNVERVQFSDYSVAYDLSGPAGQAYRLYKAAFDRSPDLPGLGYQMNALDRGFTLSQVATAFIASPEFQSKYGTAIDDTQFITLLYRNVLDREPDAGGLQFHLNEIAHGESRADVLTHFSESPENQANVIGAIQNGMIYVPVDLL